MAQSKYHSDSSSQADHSWIALVTVCVLFLASVVTPVFYTEFCNGFTSSPASTYYGWHALLFGWLALFEDGTIAWYANPFLYISMVLYVGRLGRASLIVSCAALFMAFSSIYYTRIWNDKDHEYIVQHGVGYYLWLLSFMVWAAWLSWQASKNPEKS